MAAHAAAGEGYFDEDSVLRRVISETLVGLCSQRVLLLQAAHPVAFAGFFAHTGALDDPYERLNRTTLIMNTVAFGTREHADAATARVRGMHTRVSGTLAEPAGRWPAGPRYSATDPELLLWILATLCESAATFYERWVGHLDEDERERLWQDYRVVGRLFGLQGADMPLDWPAFQRYWDGKLRSGDLFVTPQARELAMDIVMDLPVPLALKPALELANQITIGSLPASVRRLYGFSWGPVQEATLRVSREAVKRTVRPLLPSFAARIPVSRVGLPLEDQRRAAQLLDRANVAAV